MPQTFEYLMTWWKSRLNNFRRSVKGRFETVIFFKFFTVTVLLKDKPFLLCQPSQQSS